MDNTKAAKELGRNGGNKTLKLYGKKHFKNLSKLAAEKRSKKKLLNSSSTN